MAGIRTYVCNLWPKLTIGKHVHFVGGKYSTDDATLQNLIERNGAFGSSIHWQDELEEMERVSQQKEEEARNAVLRERERVLAVMRAEEKDAQDKADREALEAQAEQGRIEQAEREAEADRRAQEEADKLAASQMVSAPARSPLDPPMPITPEGQSAADAIVAAQQAGAGQAAPAGGKKKDKDKAPVANP